MNDLNPLSAPETTRQHTQSELSPIREVARLTGINSVTLRAWERRYGLIQPLRHRLYSQAQINNLGKVLGWLERGVTVRQIKPLLGETSDFLSIQDSPWRAQQKQWLSCLSSRNSHALAPPYPHCSSCYA